MLVPIDECVRRTTIPGKTTVIMATSQTSMDVFMWSLFSLLLRSSHALEHIIICVNGVDPRIGSTVLQDQKQRFLEDLRNLKYRGKDMPLTVMRVWSRVGHAECLEMGIPWVHTEMYTLMHDDAIILKRDWLEYAIQALRDSNVAMTYNPPLLSTNLSAVFFEGGHKINLPHLNSVFITCKKDRMYKLRERWTGFHLKKEIKFDDQQYEDILCWHDAAGCLGELDKNQIYNYLSMDLGSGMYYACVDNGLRFVAHDQNTVYHLGAMSWIDEHIKEKKLKEMRSTQLAELERELESTEFCDLYRKYSQEIL